MNPKELKNTMSAIADKILSLQEDKLNFPKMDLVGSAVQALLIRTLDRDEALYILTLLLSTLWECYKGAPNADTYVN